MLSKEGAFDITEQKFELIIQKRNRISLFTLKAALSDSTLPTVTTTGKSVYDSLLQELLCKLKSAQSLKY